VRAKALRVCQAPLTPAKLAFVAGKVMDKCDEIDG
jgi:hypothetical protein